MIHESQVRVLIKGGRMEATAAGIRVVNGTAITVLLAAGTSFDNHAETNFVGPDPHERLANSLRKAAGKTVEQLKAAHVKDYTALFGRVKLRLGGETETEKQYLPDRLAAYRDGKADPSLEALLFQFGRYLLISSSRPGGLPANLQGLWNNEVKPAWYSQYTTNINIEMNYWLAEPTNLAECHQPLFDWVRNLAAVQKKSADPALKTNRGWIIYSTNNTMGGTSGWHIHRPGSAWLSQHFWEHYAFGGDKLFLKNQAYPLLKEVTEYWVDHLVEAPDGKLITPDGWSPEHGPGKNEKDTGEYPGVSYDQQIVYDLFTNYIDASRVLGVDEPFRKKIDDMRSRLLGPQIGKWGQLQEWMQDLDDPEDHHRHVSHMFAVHPGRRIQPFTTPEWANAALVSLQARGDKSVGWSSAWKICIYARLRAGARAHDLVRRLVMPRDLTKTGYLEDGGSYPNLFGVGPPFQIDSNFGYTAGVTEMLLQSHAGELDLLPALPEAWSDGSVTGLRARGGVTVGLSWKSGKLTQVRLKPDQTGLFKIRYGTVVKQIRLVAGRQLVLNQL